MKKLFICLVFTLLGVSAYAQSYIETVYLKNGGIVKGIIIEQIPNDNVKIQTKDGNVFVYKFGEISKITKNSSQELIPNITGYKGFIEVGHSFGIGDEKDEDSNDIKINRLELSTSHGYQVNPYLFLGLGMGVNLYYKDDATQIAIPMFFNTRASLPTNSIVSPYLDIKIGYTAGTSQIWEDQYSYVIKKNSGFYFAPSLGARFAINGSNAINLSIGYTLQKNTIILEEDVYPEISKEKIGLNMNALTLKLGFEF